MFKIMNGHISFIEYNIILATIYFPSKKHNTKSKIDLKKKIHKDALLPKQNNERKKEKRRGHEFVCNKRDPYISCKNP